MIITRVGFLSIALVLSLFSSACAGYRHGKVVVVSAPVLSAATASTDGNDHAFIGVTTNTSGGTLFYDGSTNCSANPNAAQIKAGTTPGHVVNGSQSVSSSGVQSANPGSLSPVTAYCFYFVHTTTADSNIAQSSSFTTNGTLTFSPVFSTAWNANPAAAAFTTVINNVHAEYAACLTPPQNITVTQFYDYVDTGPGGLAATSFAASNYSYSTQIRATLIALNGKNSIQTALYANPPVSDPTGLGDSYGVNKAQAHLLGLTPLPGSDDWDTTFNSNVSVTWDSTPTCSSSGTCLASVAEHEIAEGLGRLFQEPSLFGFSSYSSTGNRNDAINGLPRFPSADGGATNLIGPSCTYNQGGSGDAGDWTGCVDSYTAAYSGAKPPISTVDIKEMSKNVWPLSHTCRQVAP